MKTMKFVSLMLMVFLLIIGCSGNNANIRNVSKSESRGIQQELNDNWSDYDIRYNSQVIVFDPKNDDKKILLPKGWHAGGWGTVEDQETWTQLVNGTKPLPNGRVNLVWGEPIREIWVHDNYFYGYVCHLQRELVGARKIDENTLRLIHNYGLYGGEE